MSVLQFTSNLDISQSIFKSCKIWSSRFVTIYFHSFFKEDSKSSTRLPRFPFLSSFGFRLTPFSLFRLLFVEIEGIDSSDSLDSSTISSVAVSASVLLSSTSATFSLDSSILLVASSASFLVEFFADFCDSVVTTSFDSSTSLESTTIFVVVEFPFTLFSLLSVDLVSSLSADLLSLFSVNLSLLFSVVTTSSLVSDLFSSFSDELFSSLSVELFSYSLPLHPQK